MDTPITTIPEEDLPAGSPMAVSSPGREASLMSPPRRYSPGNLLDASPKRPMRSHHQHSASSSLLRHQMSFDNPPGPPPQGVVVAAPAFRHVRSKSELTPVSHSQPKYRRALPEGGFMSPLAALTSHLASTYHICNPGFNYQSSRNPRRVLTKPSEAKLNNGYDNIESDYILYVNDILGIDEQRRYLVLDVLGQGTFGQVVKCQNMMTKEVVAVKVIKNKPAYLNQSMMEVSILEHLNNHVDKTDEHNLLRLKDKFVHKEHLCLVFELLSSNLYELIKQNQFRGLSTNLVRVFTQQLLDSLVVLKEARLIHCDLKPENILLKSLDSPLIKVIDFGSACHERQTVYTYIQSRFYRSPEVLLGLPYTTSIDMWSLGCICAELFLGLPIFPGTSEYNQLSRIIDTLGTPPNWMIEMGKNAGNFMEKYVDEYGRKQYRLKSRDKYSREFNTNEQPSKQYFPSTNLREIVMSYPLPRRNMKKSDVDKEMQNRVAFVDFLTGLLNLNPFERWTPQQAAMHPFITESKFVGPYVPPFGAKTTATTATSRFTRQAQPQHHHQSQPMAQPVQNTYYNSDIYVNPQRSQPQMPPPQPQQAIPPPPMYIQQQQQPPQPQQQPQQTQRLNNANQSMLAATAAHHHHQQQQQQRRPRASTLGNHLDTTVPGPIQRATALMNASEPIRAQPSPAYFPPPELYANDAVPEQQQPRWQRQPTTGQAKQRTSGNAYGEVVKHLEDGLSNYMA
ncbi:dual specificity protein kinase Yak1p [Trichomonascus vanleenenianus]|uniref:YAK1 family protein kinase n=1 Tax=Trichomonascus vanleenenianus TaxID=2268995 RepID=UPI003ECAC410